MAMLCVVLCAHGCILYTGQCPPLGTPPLKFPSLPISIPPTLLPFSSPSLRCFLLPPLASPLPSFLRSVQAYVPSSLVPFLNLLSLPPLPLPPSLTSSLPQALSLLPPSPLSPRSLPPSPSLTPICHPASLLPCLPLCLSARLRRIIQCTPCVVSGQQLH